MSSRWWRVPWPVVLAPLLIFWDAVVGLRLLAPGDGFQQYIPWYLLARRAWTSGHLPTWNPFAYGGSPHLATNQPAVFYLPSLSFLALPPVLANNLFIVANFMIAGLGAWALARHVTRNNAGALIAGLSFGLSGFMFARVGHQSLQATAALLPWVILGFERLRERRSPGRFIGASAPIALSVLAGHSQILFTNVLALGIYAVVVGLLELRKSKGAPVLLAGAALLAGLAFAAVQLLPTIRILGDTSRVQITFSEAMTYSFPKSHAILLVFPYLFGNHFPTGTYAAPYGGEWNLTEMTGYPGVGALVLAAAGLAVLRKDRRLVALTASGAFTALLALGPATPLSSLFYRLPVYGQFRSWARYIVVFDLAVAMLAACGMAQLTNPERRRSSLRWSAGAAASILLLAVVAPKLKTINPYLPLEGATLPSLIVPASAAVLVVVGAFLLVRTHRQAFAWFLLAVVGIDLYLSFGGFYEWKYGSRTTEDLATVQTQRPFSWGTLRDESGGLDRYVFVGGDVGPIRGEFVHATDERGYLSVNGNNPLAPDDFLEAVGMTPWGAVFSTEELWGRESDILDLLRVTTVLVDPKSSRGGPDSGSLLTNGTAVDGGRLVRYDYAPRLPQAFLVGAAIQATREEALAALKGSETFSPGEAALIEGACASCTKGPPGTAGVVKRVDWGINSVRAVVDADRAAMLVLSQSWFPGWHAWVDGKPAPVLRVEGLVQGIPVPPGRHRVDMRYRAPGLKLGFFVSLVSLATLIAWAILDKKARRYGFSA